MEQIKNGMMELMKHITVSQMTAGKQEAVNGGESEFGKLLEQKNVEAKKEAPAEKTETPETPKENGEKVETARKPQSDKDEETCDVAREAACAQMVWLVGETVTAEPAAMQNVSAEAVAGEVVELTAAAAQETVTQEGAEILQPQNMEVQENGEAVETGLPQQQTVETVQTNEQTDMGGTDAKPFAEKPEFETEMKVKVENGETGGEAAAVEAPVFKDVEAAPIKVAEAPAEVEAENVSEQITEKLSGVLENGESKVEIQLTPEALGKVTVELVRGADGALSIILNAESAQTRDILQKSVSTLQEAIMDRGQQNVQIEVSRGEESQRQNDAYQDLQDGRNGNQQQQQRREQETRTEDFLQQLRLGLVDVQEGS